jgi:hypothetical protein
MRRTKFPAGRAAPQQHAMEHVRLYEEAAVKLDMGHRKLLRVAQNRHINPQMIANYWFDLATADVRELTPRVCCRYCWGVDNMYQFTKNEMIRLQRKHHRRMMTLPEEKRVPFDEEGGDGFDRTAAPNRDCIECRGVGVFDLAALDLSKISRGAALLYDGISIRSDGSVEIKTRDRTKAMQMLQRLMGYEVERKMVLVRTFDPTQLQDEELVREIERLREELRKGPSIPGGDKTKIHRGGPKGDVIPSVYAHPINGAE